jgi:hypothetical protein
VLHAVRRLADEADESTMFVQADLVNAFNLADREAGLRGL